MLVKFLKNTYKISKSQSAAKMKWAIYMHFLRVAVPDWFHVFYQKSLERLKNKTKIPQKQCFRGIVRNDHKN